MIQICENEQVAGAELTSVEGKKRKRGYDYAEMIHEAQFYLRPKSVAEAELLASLGNASKAPLIQTAGKKVRVHPNQLALF